MTGCGFFLSTARFNNSFLDCEANVHPSAEACFRLGAMTDTAGEIDGAGSEVENADQMRHLDSPGGLSASAAGAVYRIGVHPRP
jgi:hypothetical protein